ncbi:MAG: hypothetical protein LQ347_006359, partial [Umbilicaria vellea]
MVSVGTIATYVAPPDCSPPQQSPMNHRRNSQQHQCIPESATSHPDDPIPHEPNPGSISEYCPAPKLSHLSSQSSAQSLVEDSPFSSDGESPQTPQSDTPLDDVVDLSKSAETTVVLPLSPRKRRASTKLIAQRPSDVQRILGDGVGDRGIRLIEKVCCGGGCCFMDALEEDPTSASFLPVVIPDNDAFRSLQLKLGPLSLDSKLTNIVDLPPQTLSFSALGKDAQVAPSTVHQHPPAFVTPHAPYEVFSAKVHHARELTKPGAEKRTYHFDLDVTDYPEESGNVDFVVGGAIGVCAPNSEEVVTEMFDLLNLPSYVRDKR